MGREEHGADGGPARGGVAPHLENRVVWSEPDTDRIAGRIGQQPEAAAPPARASAGLEDDDARFETAVAGQARDGVEARLLREIGDGDGAPGE